MAKARTPLFTDETDCLVLRQGRGNCRDEESNDSGGCAGGGIGWGVGRGLGAACGCFGGETADDVCGSAADEAGERSADFAEWPVGDVLGDGGGPREEHEGESPLGGSDGCGAESGRLRSGRKASRGDGFRRMADRCCLYRRMEGRRRRSILRPGMMRRGRWALRSN